MMVVAYTVLDSHVYKDNKICPLTKFILVRVDWIYLSTQLSTESEFGVVVNKGTL